ncbi:rRNA-processing protein Efg1p [[Candida] anglica]|uniref:rRNA-processing protein EFG1 n=1 Tax=[Candida] anglica TaxID=148631 RepID=A0ABP0EP87_9ASCO
MAHPNHNHNSKNHSQRRAPAIEVAGVLGGGAAKLKKKIRDIGRLLKKDTLPAHVRVDNERALKALQVELQNTERDLKAKNTAKKYHMVRFFERKKAIRKLKQAMKAYDEVAKTEVRKDIKKARKVVRHSEVDVAYVVLFPKEEKYISLYPNAKENEDKSTLNNAKAKRGTQLTEQRRREFRKEVETLIDEDKLPFTFADVLSGKAIRVEQTRHRSNGGGEIDAPEQEDADNGEDDFFE